MAVKPLPIEVIDLSHWNGTMDYDELVANGIKGVYLKVTEGATIVDPKYAKVRAEFEKRGVPVGGYHFASPDGGDAVAEARWFVKHANIKPGNLDPVLDFEKLGFLKRILGLFGKKRRTQWRDEWITEVRRLAPVVKRGGLYTPFDFTTTGGMWLWVARYHNGNAMPRIPKPFTRYLLRQFSNGVFGVPRTGPGLVGKVDLNCLGPGADIEDIMIPKPKPPKQKDELLHIVQSSMEIGDNAAQATADLRKLFNKDTYGKRGMPHVIGFTEAGVKHIATAVSLAIKNAGYREIDGIGGGKIALRGDCQFCSKTDLKVLEPQPTQPGAHGDRGVLAVQFFSPEGNVVTFFEQHWVTAFGRGNKRRDAKHIKQTEAMIRLMREGAEGTAIVFGAGDLNVHEKKVPDLRPGSPERLMTAAGMVSIYDELQTYPVTMGGVLFDYIWSYTGDTRVSAVDVVVHPKRNSNHRAVSGFYMVKGR
jgi:GH25 family lysozyme M1 (1,4-beta-N-acetylmuramidase)